MGFDPCNLSLKIRESIKTLTPQGQLTWECEGSFSHILLHSWEDVPPGPPSYLALLQAFALVTSSRLGLR